MSTATGLRARLRRGVFALLARAIRAAGREQGLTALCRRLEDLVPDISDERTQYRVDSDYLRTSFRMLDAFQMALVSEFLPAPADGEPLRVLDIGDSGGRHQIYLRGLLPDRRIESLSVNLDAQAVERIRARGLAAVCARAEDVGRYLAKADVAFCFEMIEHLSDPIRFLHGLAEAGVVQRLVVTVPYVRRSRVALDYVRLGQAGGGPVSAENVHVFEFSPDEWELVFLHSGWRALDRRIYLQYPRRHPARIAGPVFARIGHEGFAGFVLEKDDQFSRRYSDW